MNQLKSFKRRLSSFLRYLKYKYLISEKKKLKFKYDIKKFERKIKLKENFAFLRFSDGEIFIIQNKKLVISNNFWILDDVKKKAIFSKNEKKSFIPKKHQFYRDQLIKSLKFNKKNYFKGIACTCCNGYKDVSYIKNLVKFNKNLTFSNLFQNGNYPRFINKTLDLFKNRDIILVVNKNSNTDTLPFKIKKKFEVGENCLINDYFLINKIKKFIKQYKIKDTVFLISASSLSNLLVYELYKDFDNNTYIDIGSTLNYFLNDKKNKNSRTYLGEFWGYKKEKEYLNRFCYW